MHTLEGSGNDDMSSSIPTTYLRDLAVYSCFPALVLAKLQPAAGGNVFCLPLLSPSFFSFGRQGKKCLKKAQNITIG